MWFTCLFVIFVIFLMWFTWLFVWFSLLADVVRFTWLFVLCKQNHQQIMLPATKTLFCFSKHFLYKVMTSQSNNIKIETWWHQLCIEVALKTKHKKTTTNSINIREHKNNFAWNLHDSNIKWIWIHTKNTMMATSTNIDIMSKWQQAQMAKDMFLSRFYCKK